MTDRPKSPQRVQRQRTKGWRMPEGARYVGRPTRFGNPCHWFPSTQQVEFTDDGGTVVTRLTREQAHREARTISTQAFRDMLASPESRAFNDYPSDAEIRETLAGYDLACWCPLGHPCHADVLLEVANHAG